MSMKNNCWRNLDDFKIQISTSSRQHLSIAGVFQIFESAKKSFDFYTLDRGTCRISILGKGKLEQSNYWLIASYTCLNIISEKKIANSNKAAKSFKTKYENTMYFVTRIPAIVQISILWWSVGRRTRPCYFYQILLSACQPPQTCNRSVRSTAPLSSSAASSITVLQRTHDFRNDCSHSQATCELGLMCEIWCLDSIQKKWNQESPSSKFEGDVDWPFVHTLSRNAFLTYFMRKIIPRIIM